MKRLILTMIDSKILSPIKGQLVNFLINSNISLWAKLHTGQFLKVDMSSSVGRSIYLRGSYEIEVEQCMRHCLQSGGVFIDIGANIGYFTIICAEIVGTVGEVHSFDPHLKANQLLAESIIRNRYEHVHLNKQALSNKVGELGFVALKNSAFSWTLPINQNNPVEREQEEIVSAIPLDQYVSQQVNKPIDLIKIDVEGAEYNVLLGAQKTLKDNSPTIILEAQDWSLERFGYSIDNIFTYLSDLGYRAFDLAGSRIKDAVDARVHLKRFNVQNLIFKKEKTSE
jgi:FkbM family methyltransferase